MSKDGFKHIKINRFEHDESEDEHDCAICRATAAAERRGEELSEEELMAVFAEQNAENSRKGKMPEMIITYRCARCGDTVMNTDDREDESECFECGTGEFLKEVRRDPISPQLIAQAMTTSAERMVRNLQKAFDIGKEIGFKKGEEEELLKALAKAKTMRDETFKLADEELNMEGDKE